MSSEQHEPAEQTARRLAEHIASIAAGPLLVTRVVAVALADDADRMEVARLAAPLVRALGFAPIDASHDVADVARLGHEHTAVFLYDERDVERASRIVRRLARVSDRPHLVIDLRPAAGGWTHGGSRIGDVVFVRERVATYGGRPETRQPDARLGRAVAFLERGRSAAGERWLRAAVESARRRHDEAAEARAACRLLEEMQTREQWQEARRLATTLCDRLTSWHARTAVATELTAVLVAMGHLARAEVIVAAIRVEAAARREEVPRLVRVRHAELCFWSRRFEEARNHLPAEPAATAVEAGVAELVKWAVGEAGVPDARAFAARPRLARACVAEDHLAHGRVNEAQEILGRPPERPSEAELEEALLARLRDACGPVPSSGPSASDEFIRRRGARGLTRWGMRRTGVHLIHAVPALLQIVHDAEDEITALEGGCAWIRAHVGADGAALVATDPAPRLVAGDGIDQRDLTNDRFRDALAAPAGRAVARGASVVVTAPVRAHGAAIGVAIVSGAGENAASLTEGAALLASLCAPAMRARLDALAVAGAGQSLASEILGVSPAIAAVRDAIARAAVTSFPVLVEGESGTGKELAARALHRLSPRRDRRLAAVNCAALSDELVEAELFGYARGAFTGAIGTRPGLFEEASGSTLLLDEVSELSPRGQAKLLRALQEREIRRLGENVPRAVDVRVLAATNRPLTDEVGRGRFREDLLFRLAVVRIRLPALRERVEDIPRIANAHWHRMLGEVGKRAALGPDALAALSRHDWPGNVRELQNVIAGLALVAPARGRVSARHVSQVLAGRELTASRVLSLDAARRVFERGQVAAALARHAGHRSAAAQELGLTRQGLAKAMKRLGLEECDTAGVA